MNIGRATGIGESGPGGTDFYPSCVVNLTLRYDEALQVAEDPNEVFTRDAQAPLTSRAAISSEDPAARRRRVRTAPVVTMGRPYGQAFDDPVKVVTSPHVTIGRAYGGDQPPTASRVNVPLTFGSDGFTVFTARVPVKCGVTLTHPRQAGTFNLTFDFREFPVDPRLLRAVGVEIHMGCVSPENYARGMGGERDSSGRPLSILKTRLDIVDPFKGDAAVDGSTLLMFGTADRWFVKHDAQGSTVQIEGRDTRAIFIDAKIPVGAVSKIDLRNPIDRVIADVIATVPTEYDLDLDVFTDAGEWPGGFVPSPGDVDGLTRVRLSSSGSKPKSTPSNGERANYWDLITNYCNLVGAVPYIRENALWIRPCRSIFDVVTDDTIDTPFAGGKPRMVNGELLRVRRMVWGRNLKSLAFDRKFNGKIVPTIKTVAIDDQVSGEQRLLFGQWPPKDSPAAQAKGEGDELRVPVPGVRSKERLDAIARDIYEEIGRGEMGGTAETDNLASFGGGFDDPDLVRLRPTDPIEFVVDARQLRSISPLVSELNEVERRTFEEEVKILYQKLGDRDVARVLVATARGAIVDMLSFYQVTECRFDWGSASGIKIAFDFQNYVVSRHGGDERGLPGSKTRELARHRVALVGAQRKAKIKAARRRAASLRDSIAAVTDAGDREHVNRLLKNKVSPADVQRMRRAYRLERARVRIGTATGEGAE